nr:hypothetical protein [uncultured Carboxylicivirga sp.]
MNSYRKIFAYLLLAVYGIVFAHNIIPHHHHYEGGVDDCAVQLADKVHHHSDLCNHAHDIELAENDKDGAEHYVCEFDVKPVVNNEISFAIYYLPNSIEELLTPIRQSVKPECQYYPQKLLESYCSAVPLRAPPVA